MGTTFEKTINDKKFNKVFIEVPCTGSLGVRAHEELRLFRPKEIIDNCFDLDMLRKFLTINIGHYVFSRSRIMQFRNDEEEFNVGLAALDIMQKSGRADERGSGNEVGELMLYAFLESVLNAPKLYSKIELKTSVKSHVSVTDGIHLKLLDSNGEGASYEMVFGSSSVTGDLGDAIDEAFQHVEAINKHSKDEIQLVSDAIFNLPEDDPAVLEIDKIINPEPGKQVGRNSAYGIFLGYSIELDKSRVDEDYRQSIGKKMDDDILYYLPVIKKRISELKLENRSFYIYIVPFDNAEKDKKDIMKSVMREGAIDE